MCHFGLPMWFCRWKFKNDKSCTILCFHVTKLKVLPKALSFEKFQNWDFFVTSQEQNQWDKYFHKLIDLKHFSFSDVIKVYEVFLHIFCNIIAKSFEFSFELSLLNLITSESANHFLHQYANQILNLWKFLHTSWPSWEWFFRIYNNKCYFVLSLGNIRNREKW